jgi:V8-like Glu-specific endopeptidase
VKTYKEYNDRYFDDHGEKDESIPVEQYTGENPVDGGFVDHHEGPVGQVQWNDDIHQVRGTHIDLSEYAGLRECSGTLIDDDLFLTAGHCFVVNGGPPPAQVAEQMHVDFNYQEDSDGNPPDETDVDRYDVDSLVELAFQHAGLDYAILELEGDPGSEYGTVEVAGADAQKGDTLCMIAHPNGLPKRILTGHASHFHDVRIGYDDINTAPGSSGAGLLNDDGALVGVHSESGIGINFGHNHGIRISAILNASPTLRDRVDEPIYQYTYESHSAMTDSRRSTSVPKDESYAVNDQAEK